MAAGHPPPGGTTDNLSILCIERHHISRWLAYREANFIEFLNFTLPSVEPEFVLMTGDALMAKSKGINGKEGHQNIEEWRRYREILEKYDLWARYWVTCAETRQLRSARLR